MRRRAPTSALATLVLGTLTGCRVSPPAPAPAVPVQDPAAAPSTAPLEIVNPPVVESKDGALEYTLTAGPAKVTVAGQTFVSNVYNGQYISPVVRAKRGDQIHITYTNDIDAADIEISGPQSSNVHYHGMGIPPVEPADDPYIAIPSSKETSPQRDAWIHAGHDPSLVKDSPTYEYRWTVPDQHPQGLFWMHPHAHGATEPQILSGMSTLLIIDGMIDEHYPELTGAEERILILKDIDLPGAAEGAAKTKTINGIAGGVFRTQPGDVEVWEIANIGADAFFDITVDGHKFWVIGRDGNVLHHPEHAQSVFLPPAARATIVFKAGAVGEYGVRSLEIDTGPAGDPNPEVKLATFIVEGEPVDKSALADRMKLPAANTDTITPSAASLRAAPITRRRRVVYTESSDGKTFFINDKEFDMGRVDFEATLGDVEEWTIVNDTDERHSFHIHQIDFLVTEINGDDEDATGLRDTIDVPYRDPATGKPGEVKAILPFTDPEIVGKFLFHCHISEHSDAGMMGNMVVLPAKTPKAPRTK